MNSSKDIKQYKEYIALHLLYRPPSELDYWLLDPEVNIHEKSEYLSLIDF